MLAHHSVSAGLYTGSCRLEELAHRMGCALAPQVLDTSCLAVGHLMAIVRGIAKHTHKKLGIRSLR